MCIRDSLNYECTFTSQPDYSGTNTATATWDNDAAHTANGSAMGTAAANFVTPTEELDRTITVKDTPKDGTTTTLGELDYLYAPDTTNYGVEQNYQGVAGTCTTYSNTADLSLIHI